MKSLIAVALMTGCCLAQVAVGQDQAKPAAQAQPARPAARAQARPAAPAVAPTEANVPYGKHPKQVIDFYKAESSQPTPLVFYIHGGGWRGGSKNSAPVGPFLSKGISVVSVEYRFTPEATADGVEPPVKGPLHDAARALQFVRSKAKEWNIDKQRIGATGGSAGACSSLWLAFHDDLADKTSDDPVARESTRLTCAAVNGAQTSLDPQQMKEWMPNSTYGGHAFGLASFAAFLSDREKILPWIKEYSPYELVSSDDPPVALYYRAAPAMGEAQPDPTHSANFGVGLQEKCKQAGVDCQLVYPGAKDVKYPRYEDYLISKLTEKK
jgi:acetyl esterase/lipase